ncbi:MAG: iron-sulfur cluster assembly scaffold protein [Gammaproteobacteria bacterium]|nr:iron-sulfur cluster assembly scaffold protein [Gammaproteobacteria bacterium]
MTGVARSALPEPYNQRVRALFEEPQHAGEVVNGPGRRFEGRASESAAGAQIVLAAVVSDGILAVLRFRVFGCPHLIAAAELTCERFEGEPVKKLQDFSVSDLMETLGVPVEKTGRILRLEDAVRALLLQIDRTATNKD